MITRIDHLQLAAPKGCETAAREFYGSILGLAEIEKPASLRARGGCWIRCGDQQLHIGVETDFRAAKKAHPAFGVTDLAKLRGSLAEHAVKITDDDSLPGTRRFFAEDPWGKSPRVSRSEIVVVAQSPIMADGLHGFGQH